MGEVKNGDDNGDYGTDGVDVDGYSGMTVNDVFDNHGNHNTTIASVTTANQLIDQQNLLSLQSFINNGSRRIDENGEGKRVLKECSGEQSDKRVNQGQELFKLQVNDLTIQMTYLSHQVTLLLNALHVPSCQCPICKPYYQTQVEMFKLLKNGITSNNWPASSKAIENDGPSNEKQAAASEVPKVTLPTAGGVPVGNIQPIPNIVPAVNDYESLLSQIFTQTGVPVDGAQVAAAAATSLPAGALGISPTRVETSLPKPFAANRSNKVQNTNCTGRRSKYCSPEEKKVVAEYAEAHGPSAAARKFGIPTPVAAYYHRKEYRQKPLPTVHTAHLLSQTNSSGSTNSSTDIDRPSVDSLPGSLSSVIKSSSPNDSTFTGEQQLKLNPAHITGNPGFLRGRGRGRPKLIGDELDAALVDYMVQVKQSDPRGHMTASQALTIARAYILEKAPGLLEEHGGQIKLKLTWAMKLVARITERQKEIEYGLPAGTISNMTRTTTNANVPGGNFMADVVTQNFFSQHMSQIISQAIAENPINEQMKHIMSHSLVGTTAPSATPEIVNIRELELPKPDDGDLKGEIVDAIVNDKHGSMEAAGQMFDTDIENQADIVENQSSQKKLMQQRFISSNTF
ncbi:unnamed protein product [Thelazia callipaeda]|uniref:Transcription factor n=1 Tax=Thelazia callipaeda TaxID=103827 RepID=A0A0N5CLA4_THECL|nr:unnamed protein product [Thelazia callipaeda]